jgi:hypothetical protein
LSPIEGTNAVESTSRSSRQPEDRPWLTEKVYGPRRGRTVELVKSSIGSLMKDGERVSLAGISARSKEVDPEGRGISASAILNNQEAHLYYQQHRGWKAGSGNPRKICKSNAVVISARIKSDRDTARVGHRYLKLNKTELVERLIAVEHAHAVLQERWFQLNEEVLRWRLQTARPEPQLRRGEA